MLDEYKRYLLRALFEIDYVLEDMEFDNLKGREYHKLKEIKKEILKLDDTLSKSYKIECEKWK
jgi:hypothetical protein